MSQRFYRVSVAVSIHNGGCATTIQVPTFHFDAEALGLVSAEHAEKLARSMFEQLVPNSQAAACAVEV